MTRKTNGKSGKGLAWLALFSLPFACVGVGMAVMLAWTLTDYLAMRAWEEVPAVIVEAKLEASRGDGSTTYRAAAEYVYTYNGRQYAGSRVSLHRGSDNIGSFQQDAHRELSEHKRSREPFRCYVDSEDPKESILYRRLRWEMVGFYTLFVLVFGGVGFGLLIGSLIGLRKKRTETVDVPVSKTAESREDFEFDESLIADDTAGPNPDLDLSRAGVIKTLSPAGPGTRYVFPMARHLGTVLAVTMFFLIWTGAIAGMVYLKAPLLFPVIFGLIDLLLAFWTVDLWLYRSVVDVSRYEVAVTGGLLGLGRTRHALVSDIHQIV